MSMETERGNDECREDMEEPQKYVKALALHGCMRSYGSLYHTDYTFCHHPKIPARDHCSFLGPLPYSVARAAEGQDEVLFKFF